MNSATSILNFSPHHTLALTEARTSLRSQPQCLDGHYHQPALPILLCHCLCQTPAGGTGISTSCPSPTALALGLGPDLPWEDEPSPGNLKLSTIKILTSFSLLIPAFSLALRPPPLTVRLRPTARRSSTPTYLYGTSDASSVRSFSPGHFRRITTRPVSCYALFE